MPFVLFGVLSLGIKLCQLIGRGAVSLFTAREEGSNRSHRADEEPAGQERMTSLKVVKYF